MAPQPGVTVGEKENASSTMNKRYETPKTQNKTVKKSTPKSNTKKNVASNKGMMDLSKWLVKGDKTKDTKPTYSESSATECSENEIVRDSSGTSDVTSDVDPVKTEEPEKCKAKTEITSATTKRKDMEENDEDRDDEDNELNLSGRQKRSAVKRRRIIVLEDSDSDTEVVKKEKDDSDFEIDEKEVSKTEVKEEVSDTSDFTDDNVSDTSPFSDDDDEEESLASIKKKVANKVAKQSWGSLAPWKQKQPASAKKPTKSPKASVGNKKKATNAGGATKASSTPGAAKGGVPRSYNDECANLDTISEPQAMFDDMVSKLPELKDLHKHLNGRSLRVATMCSGTESPILALDMIALAAKSQFDIDINIEHIFSCEIEPFKQAYIERNFHPPILFRDIRELGNKRAMTAYGSMVKVPGECDILIAGTSCVDYSNLNTKQKTITQKGESGQTFRGMLQWIKKFQPPLVIIENVSGAPWDTKVICKKAYRVLKLLFFDCQLR